MDPTSAPTPLPWDPSLRATEMPRRLLLVEDDPDVRAVLPAFLAHPDLVIETAFDFESGVAMAWKSKPHVMLVDVRLPGRSGFEVFVELRRARPATRIILISAYTATEVMARAEQLGAYAFLRKPFELRERRLVLEALGLAEVSGTSPAF